MSSLLLGASPVLAGPAGVDAFARVASIGTGYAQSDSIAPASESDSLATEPETDEPQATDSLTTPAAPPIGGVAPVGAEYAQSDSTPPAPEADSLATEPEPAATDSLMPPPAPPEVVETARDLRVGALSVTGNTVTDSVRILRTFEVLPGSHFSDDALRRGIRKLFALGLFDDVWIEKFEHGDMIDVLIHVHERPRIGKIGFSGNQKRESGELERKLFLHVGEVYSPTTVQTQIDSLMKYYRDEGYAQATIEATTDTAASPGRVALTFVIKEGEKVKITDIRFEGVTAFGDALKKKLKTKKKGWFGGGEIKEENVAEDREKLEAYYHDHGYRDMRLAGRRLEPGDTPRHLTLVVTVEEGPLYRMGNVSWAGNHTVETGTLARMWDGKPGDIYSAGKIEKTQAAAYAEYAERGYLYLGVEPREAVQDSTVDLTFTISEGQPSHIRLVNISGNRSTREKVIRREIAIHEGDRFRRSALVRTQGDIFRLGIFEDVQVDFAPAETTDVDLNLKVKEKQVGTASAGAGYTSESGLTGFVELGHKS